MIAEYRCAKNVLRCLGYEDCEADEIVREIKKGNFAFPYKKTCAVDARMLADWTCDECTGIDIPVLWTPSEGEASDTIVLLAQDPLRDEDYWRYTQQNLQREHHTIIGTPYALHLSNAVKQMRVTDNGKRKRYNVGVYLKIIESIVAKGYNVYCTDIFKCYMSKSPCGKVSQLDVDIFSKECSMLNPLKVVCMGKKAREGADLLRIEPEKIIAVRHPRSRPQRTTSVIVNEISCQIRTCGCVLID